MVGISLILHIFIMFGGLLYIIQRKWNEGKIQGEKGRLQTRPKEWRGMLRRKKKTITPNTIMKRNGEMELFEHEPLTYSKRGGGIHVGSRMLSR
mmetsp:Transcript_24344/g.34294  ORF Transcript_24344/g.34294 Transcript_24344/m.34294 type:complete len:94 (+) Transcript_24344:322-603(+)